MNEIFTYFPDEIKQELMKYNLELLEEIRIRNGRKIFLKIGQNEIQTSYTTDTEDILKIFQRICDNSVYSYQNQICNRIYYYKGWPQNWTYRKCSF